MEALFRIFELVPNSYLDMVWKIEVGNISRDLSCSYLQRSLKIHLRIRLVVTKYFRLVQKTLNKPYNPYRTPIEPLWNPYRTHVEP